jgi:hypothetical protein
MRQKVNFLPILIGFLLVIIYFVILYTLLNLNNKTNLEFWIKITIFIMKKHEGFKNLVHIFMKNNPNKRKSEVADRFMAIGIKRATSS